MFNFVYKQEQQLAICKDTVVTATLVPNISFYRFLACCYETCCSTYVRVSYAFHCQFRTGCCYWNILMLHASLSEYHCTLITWYYEFSGVQFWKSGFNIADIIRSVVCIRKSVLSKDSRDKKIWLNNCIMLRNAKNKNPIKRPQFLISSRNGEITFNKMSKKHRTRNGNCC